MANAAAITHPFNHWHGDGSATHAYPNCIVEFDFHEGTGTITADAQDFGTITAVIGNTSIDAVGHRAGTYATSFNGIDERIDCGSYTSYDTPTTEITVATWVWSPASAPDDFDVIVARPANAAWNSNGWGLYWHKSKPHFYVCDVTAFANLVPATLEGWHHICGVYNGSETEIYWDGVASGNPCSYVGTISAVGASMAMAYDPINSSRFMNGKISQVAIYDEAKSAEFIAKLAANS